jgi:hypothetical protein
MMPVDCGSYRTHSYSPILRYLLADALVATLTADQASELRSDFLAIPQDIAQGICLSQMAAAQAQWKVWATFCASVNTNLGLSQFQDPVPTLLLFARHFRKGRIAPKGNPVNA